MTYFKRILMLSVLVFPLIAEENKKTKLLENIKDSIVSNKDFEDRYRGYSSILKGIDISQESQVSLSPYWTNQARYHDSFDRMQLIQLCYDVLLAFPHKEPTPGEVVQAAIDIYAHMTHRDLDVETAQIIMKVFFSSQNNYIFQVYKKLHLLRQKTLSCSQYWDGGVDSHPTLVAQIASPSFKGPLKEKLSYCDKPVCSTVQRPFNGFFVISQNASTVQKMLSSITCQGPAIHQGKHIDQKIRQCDYVKTLIQSNRYIKPAPSKQDIALSLKEGKAYIEGITNHSTPLLDALKVIVLLNIDSDIDNPRYDQESFANIYTTPDKLPKCESQSTGNLTSNNHRCQPDQIQPTNQDVDVFLERLLGTNLLPSIIQPALPIGLTERKENDIVVSEYILIAGNYHRFRLGPNKMWKASPPSLKKTNVKSLYLSEDTLKELQSKRKDLMDNFCKERKEMQSSAIYTLLNKSMAVDLINEVREQKETVTQYEHLANGYRTTPLKMLENSSKWRLSSGNQNWLANIATMTNVSLLREIAILLAEIKNIQFLLFANTQKSLLLKAIINAKLNVISVSRKFKDGAVSESRKYAWGGASGEVNGDSTPLPPNQNALDNATDQKLKEAEKESNQYS